MSNYSQTFSIKPWFPLQQFSYRPVFDLAHLPDFSDDNLAKDEYLRSQMDNQGWVNILTITDFPRNNKLRKRQGWERWINPMRLHILLP
ncbi:unnamed protein product [Arabidopsis thaliana]|uniref:(thale cress) hypothetical protein n=1 Tax=Arabidopsis thaliana TaxID=3702 RepID=A0A7G2E6I5_ARATH|nr:unnamed protein product [Arabidopsis thaliana]